MSSTPRFQTGEQVYSRSRQRQGRIVAPLSIGNQWHYRVDLGTGTTILLGERDLEPTRSPLDRLTVGDYGYASDFDLLTRATALSFAYQYEGLSCLSNSRLDPKPYQVFVAHRTLQDLYPRYLLADEVGLGKTIEAGLILKELKARGLAERVLIVVPASLREQWKGEMEVKFNERFHIYDSGTIRENLRRSPNRNPWEADSQVIVSLQFARQRTSQANQPAGRRRRDDEQENRWIDEVDWDLVIFDEAHHLRRYLRGSKLNSDREVTKSYRLGQALAERTKSLLLLTATPLQLSRYETYSLIELLDTSLFSSYSEFLDSMSLTSALIRVNQLLRDPQQDSSENSGLYADAFWQILIALDEFRDHGHESEFWHGLIDSCLQVSSSDKVAQVRKRIDQLGKACHEVFDQLYRYSNYGSWDKSIVVAALQEFRSFVAEYFEAFCTWAENQHKLSHIMIRNRKREVLKGEFVRRRAYRVSVHLTSEERELYDLVSAYIKSSYAHITGQTMALGFVLTTFRKLLVSSPHALTASLERRAERIENALQMGWGDARPPSEDDLEERAETLESIDQLDDLFSLTGGLSPAEARAEVKNLRKLAARARAIPVDSKAEKLLAAVILILDNDSTEKVLIFMQFRETQTYLQGLFEREGYQVALFHGEGGDSTYSKRVEFERFKKNPAVRIMLSTEVGGEGLNFQFCHVMFNYDLPWNPMRIEQRIGRLDRIGQKRDVHIYNFFLEETLDARILVVLQERIRLFEETIGNLDPILGEIEDRIEEIVLADEEQVEQKLAELEEWAEERVHKAREAEAKMADFIMDARSYRRDTVDEILGREPPVSSRDIEQFTCDFLARYPHDTLESIGDNVCIITVPPRFRQDCRRLYDTHLEERYKGTFDPKTAIEEDTFDFFAFGHPLFDAIIRYCTDNESNNHFDAQTAFRVLHHSDHAGHEGVQFNYVITLEGVRTYKKLVSVVLDLDGRYDEELSHLILSLPADEEAAETLDVGLSIPVLRDLEERSQTIIAEIAGQEMSEARDRNARDYAEVEEKLTRLFDYRLRNQQEELERRQARLEDAKQRGQTRIIPAWEGQVRATRARIEELEKHREEELSWLQEQQEVNLSIELLNADYVKIL